MGKGPACQLGLVRARGGARVRLRRRSRKRTPAMELGFESAKVWTF